MWPRVARMDNDRKPIDWTTQLAEQLDFHWQHLIRPRFDGLTDDEYFWEPVPGCWSIRPRAEVEPELARGSGDYVLENAWPARSRRR